MKKSKLYLLMITAIVTFCVIARVLPHNANFAPMGAIALFSIAFYKRKSLALAIPVLAWWFSDLFLNNTAYASSEGFTWFTYDQLFSILALVAIIGLGAFLLKKMNIAKVIVGSVSASLIFFLVSNFGVWAQGLLYPKTIIGLTSCYTMALPFYQATFVSDLVFTGVFFTAMYFFSKTEIAQNKLIAIKN